MTTKRRRGRHQATTTFFFERVYAVVRAIPRARVATYGEIARLLGLPRGA